MGTLCRAPEGVLVSTCFALTQYPKTIFQVEGGFFQPADARTNMVITVLEAEVEGGQAVGLRETFQNAIVHLGVKR